VYTQDAKGYVDIGPEYFYPQVRNAPVFPARDLQPGATWSADAYEVHDFYESFGIDDPYIIPFTAHYTYLGERQHKDASYPAVQIDYRISVAGDDIATTARPGAVIPQSILGGLRQIIYWDEALGQAIAAEENVRMVFTLTNGDSIEYRGWATTELTEAPVMDKEAVASAIAEDLGGDSDTEVRVTDAGVAISMENIQFYANSDRLLPNEYAKIDKIIEVLKKYPERDILVGGHTALAGTAEGRQELSAARAATVAEHLIRNGVRPPEAITVRGYGAENPIADNNTEEGRQRNRRVEIILLEN
jgi:outer membrane protein OmpA-like peptidoglycan-associated protein